MNKFRIAHISDLHFSSGASKHSKHQHSISRLFGVQQILSKHQSDRVIVSGDLTDTGHRESLLRVRNWLFSEFEVAPNERCGLNLDPATTIVVPGNHDAFNCEVATSDDLSLWQSSLEHYNEIFPDHAFTPEHPVRWDWIEKGGHGLFIVSTDTTFIGDRELDDHPDYLHILAKIPDKARGRFIRAQSAAAMSLFDLGLRGKLVNPSSGEAIPRDRFARSLKILVAHHYLFEAAGQRVKPLLSLNSRRGVFSDLASSDFDLYLCGHKHRPSREKTTYEALLPRRERSRFLLNVFRRLVGLAGVSLSISSSEGLKLRRVEALMFAVWTLVLRVRAADPTESAVPDTAFEEQIAATLKETLSAPEDFENRIRQVLASGGIRDEDLPSRQELEEIGRHLRGKWSKEELRQLQRVATRLERLVKGLSSRPFVQVVAGSATKEVHSPERVRSLEMIEIRGEHHEFEVKIGHYRWNAPAKSFAKVSDDSFRFQRSRHAVTRAVGAS